MNEVFADSFYYIALLNPADRFHPSAVGMTQKLVRPLVTSIWVLMEVADALSSPAVRARTAQFLTKTISDENTTLISDAQAWFARGLSLYGNRPDKSWSLTDCISFEIMTEKGIREALTGDHHYVQAGFQMLIQ